MWGSLRLAPIIVGPYQQAPGEVTLTDARPDQLIFNWSQIDPNCSAVQYQYTSNCGSCSLATPTSTLASCYDLQLSTTAIGNCTFSVRSKICGFTGPSSNPITVTLKGSYVVPSDWPGLDCLQTFMQHYCESQALTSLMIEICSQMVRVCLKEYFNINLSAILCRIPFQSMKAYLVL